MQSFQHAYAARHSEFWTQLHQTSAHDALWHSVHASPNPAQICPLEADTSSGPVVVVSSLDVGDDSLPVFAEIHKGAIDAEHLWSTIRAAVRARRRRSSRRAAAR